MRRKPSATDELAEFTRLFHLLEQRLRLAGARWFARDSRNGLVLSSDLVPPVDGHNWFRNLAGAVRDMDHK